MLLICGIPNAGKTTYSARFENVLHLDDFDRKPSQYKNCIRAAGEAEGDVVVEGVFNTAKKRRDLLEAVQGKPFRRVCIWLDTPTDICLQRERSYRKRSDHLVLSNAERFQPPTYDEGWDEIIVIKEGQGNEQEAITTRTGGSPD